MSSWVIALVVWVFLIVVVTLAACRAAAREDEWFEREMQLAMLDSQLGPADVAFADNRHGEDPDR